ncbi:DNA cytosine methyltransferase [Trichococcus shcherbakoviae]|uniref:DNA cytosine methyltransferase n=1 Tax=Trichococcus shcherbakoviae TaxID=2094020 RepID=UPI002AA7B944|nr:DNA cytosine methyltransferase [Trichococcus shcherbakoviae]
MKRRPSNPSKPTSSGRFRYATICSGIEAPSVAWQSLGWEAAWFSEIEPFPCSVLSHHYPEVPNLGDITKITKEQIDRLGPIDLVCGGTPCQGFSVAGLRKGLDNPRSGLVLRFLQLVGHIRPVWFLWENVPGVLSSWSAGENGGTETNDFDQLLTAILELGYGFAYRILDAQYFRVPQRRRRVFVVGHFGDWRPATAVLFEWENLRRNPPPIRYQKQEVAGCLDAGIAKRRGGGQSHGILTASPLTAKGGSGRMEPTSDNFVPVAYRTSGNCGVMEQGDRTAALNCNTDQTQQIIAYRCHGSNVGPAGHLRAGNGNETGGVPFIFQTRVGRNGRGQPKEIAGEPHVAGSFGVRRLTPRECERLQGFPDDYTLIDFNGKPAADSPRYKALGNSMAVPVMRWIGERIVKVNGILEARKQSHDSIDHR